MWYGKGYIYINENLNLKYYDLISAVYLIIIVALVSSCIKIFLNF